MEQAVEKLIHIQGFSKRMDQYELVKNLPSGLECTRSIVKHKLTGKQFELRKSLVKSNEPEPETQHLGIFEHELKARQKIIELKQIARLQDVFADEEHTYMVIETTKAPSLQTTIQAYHEQDGKQSDSLQSLFNLACSVITQVCSILRKLWSKGVVHRLINVQSIKLRYSQSKKDYKVTLLDDFDLGVALRSHHHKV